MARSGWIGVDFDGTLAKYGDGQGTIENIGEPVPLMLQRVKEWLAEGTEVRIVTARASVPDLIPPIEQWCKQHVGCVLKVTDRKDFSMVELWDDRAIQVETNTGVRYVKP